MLVFNTVPQKRRCSAAVYRAENDVWLYREREGPWPVSLLVTDCFSRDTEASQEE